MITLDGLTDCKIVLKQQNGNSYDMDKFQLFATILFKKHDNSSFKISKINVARIIINTYCIWLTKSRKIHVVLVLTNVVF